MAILSCARRPVDPGRNVYQKARGKINSNLMVEVLEEVRIRFRTMFRQQVLFKLRLFCCRGDSLSNGKHLLLLSLLFSHLVNPAHCCT